MTAEQATKPLTLIVAAAVPSLTIGKNGGLPWRLRKEMKYFKQVTSGPNDIKARNAVIMGRNTWESIPPKFRPLDSRINVVLSRKLPHTTELMGLDKKTPTLFSGSIDGALELLRRYEEETKEKVGRIYIIGGSQVYREALRHPRTRYLLLTEIYSNVPDGDAFLEDFRWYPKPEADSSAIESRDWDRLPEPALREFVGDHVDIPEQPVEEGEHRYSFTLWEAQGKAEDKR